jgi:hypothetical protein
MIAVLSVDAVVVVMQSIKIMEKKKEIEILG